MSRDICVGIFISGENDGAVNTLWSLMKNNIQQEKMHKVAADAWSHPSIDADGLLCTMQLYAKQILGEYNISSTRIIGFKEIRHVDTHQLDFFLKLFPCARFIVNTRRDLTAQSKSGFFKRNRNSLKTLQNSTMSILKWTATVPDRQQKLFLFPTELISVKNFNVLLKWIGVQGCQFIDVHHSHQKNSFRQDNRADVLEGRSNCTIQSI